MKKIGYFRITGKVDDTISYEEAYARGAEYLITLERMSKSGQISLFCACCSENRLPLTITKDLKIRVASNKQQELHADSCPKSDCYESYIAEGERNGGVKVSEEGIVFQISIPTGKKSQSTSSSSSSESVPDPSRKRTAIYEMMRIVNCVCFQKQGYSIKKKIGIAVREGKKPEWEYKDIENFNRQLFGVCNDIGIKVRGEMGHLADILYRSKEFYSLPFTEKRFIYAEILKVSEKKEDRKYQYITVKMPSAVSSNKAVVRVQSEEYDTIVEELGEDALAAESRISYMLCGYVQHDYFKATSADSQDRHYITLIKWAVLAVSKEYGLYLRHEGEEPILRCLAERHILFYRPYLEVPELGFIPTFIIPRRNAKDLVVDICKTEREYEKKKAIASKEYSGISVLLLNAGYDLEQSFDAIFKILKEKT